ncbi:MAG: Arm DNA-binding domain-containing protein [Pseudorhodobacter sp.]|nr:Arm DNA-binding domain-containing protein [Pseudorhodobacter sp.]
MATQEMTFTKGALDKATHTGGAASRYRDARYPNLYLEVGPRSKTWRYRKFWKGQNFTETLGTWPQTGVIEAAQTAAEINQRVEETGITRHDDRRRNAPEITLRVALEQHVTQALDPRQRKVSAETAAGYAAIRREAKHMTKGDVVVSSFFCHESAGAPTTRSSRCVGSTRSSKVRRKKSSSFKAQTLLPRQTLEIIEGVGVVREHGAQHVLQARPFRVFIDGQHDGRPLFQGRVGFQQAFICRGLIPQAHQRAAKVFVVLQGRDDRLLLHDDRPQARLNLVLAFVDRRVDGRCARAADPATAP